MKKFQTNNYVNAIKLSQYLNVSVPTINIWYKWYYGGFDKPADTPELPMFESCGTRQTRYWRVEDLPKIKAFKDWLPHGKKGVMGAYTVNFWGKRKSKDDFKEA